MAVGFKEDFLLKEIHHGWTTGSKVVDPRDYLIKRVGANGMAFAYSFGSLAFWNVTQEEREREIQDFLIIHPTRLTEKTGTEEFIVEESPDIKPHVEFSKLVLDQLTPSRAEVVALTLAQSAAMEYYEGRVVEVWNKVSTMVHRLEMKGRATLMPTTLYRQIGEAISMRSEVVGILHLLDRPDVIWDDSVMDSLYGDLRAVFDLPERFRALEYKIQMIQDALELLGDIARDRRLFAAEIAIILLITLEAVMSIYKMLN